MQNNIKTEQTQTPKRRRKKLAFPLPSFLAFDFKGFKFEFSEKPNHSNDANLTEKLLKKYAQPNTIVLFNGVVVFSSLPKGIQASTFIKNKKDFETYQNSQSYNLLTYYNKLYLNSGLNLDVAKNLTIEVPIRVIVAGSVNLAHFANYVARENSSVKVLEEFVLFQNCKLNYIVNTMVLDQANFTHTYVEQMNTTKSLSMAHNATLGTNGQLNLTYLNLNSGKVVHNTYVELLGKFSKAHVNTATVANTTSRFASLITMKHLNKETESNIQNVGIVNNEAQLNIDGLNIIEKGNCKSVAEQNSKIINLTDQARSIANPQLIINEYDVKAGHAASVGRLDEEQLYYLMSRGLTKPQAVELLLMAYLNETLDQITFDTLKEEVLKTIQKKIR